MAQQRFINFGDTVLAQRVNAISTAIVAPGVLEGANFSVGITPKHLRVGPNKVMLNELLLIEDSANDILIEGLENEPRGFTIIYEHQNANVQGGVPAVLLSVEGLFGFDQLPNSTVLGWILYPGGSVGLNDTMFVEAPKLQITNPNEFPSDVKVPPFVPNSYVQSETSPGVISQTDSYDPFTFQASMRLENGAAAINSIVQFFPFVAGIQPPNRVILEAKVELGASVTASLVDEDGVEYAAINSTITNTSDEFEFREMQVENVDTTKFAQNRPYFVAITTQLNPGKKVFISIVGSSSNFLPF